MTVQRHYAPAFIRIDARDIDPDAITPVRLDAPVAIAFTTAEVLYLADLLLAESKDEARQARRDAATTAAGLDIIDDGAQYRPEEITAVRAILDAARDIIHRDRAARRAEASA